MSTKNARKQATPEADVHEALRIDGVCEALLCAVARLKGFSDETISSALNVPKGTLGAFFAARNVGYRDDIRAALAKYLGINLSTGRLVGDQVHVFLLGKLPSTTSRKDFLLYMQSMGFLLRGGKAARLSFPALPAHRRVGPAMSGVHIVQNAESRALFIGGSTLTFRARFDASAIEGCDWAAGTEAKSEVPVAQRLLAIRVLSGDLTPIEFDEIFRGAEATTWADVEMSARVNSVTKDEIVQWIETVGARKAIERERAQARTGTTTATERWAANTAAPLNESLARAAGGA